MKFYGGIKAGEKLSLEDAIVNYIIDMGEALKLAFNSPDWKTSLNLFGLMIEYLEALANSVMTNKERKILYNLEILFRELEDIIFDCMNADFAECSTDQERKAVKEQYNELFEIISKIEMSIKMKYLISCVKKTYRSASEDIFTEEMLYNAIIAKLIRYGLDEYIDEDVIREIFYKDVWEKTDTRTTSSQD